MKKIITVLALVLSIGLNAQTTIAGSASLTQNSHFVSLGALELHINGCGGILTGTIIILGDLNLNGYTLFLKQGTDLEVYGNINGGGQINSCNNGNNNSAISICTSGTLQNSPNLNGMSCTSPLSSQTFDISKDFGFKYTVYNELGQVLMSGVTSSDMLRDLPKNKLLIISVEGFKLKKMINY